MLSLGITYVVNECERVRQIILLSSANLSELKEKNIAYFEILSDRYERQIAFCVSEHMKLKVSRLASGENSLIMHIGQWNERIHTTYNVSVYFTSKMHVMKMLAFVKENEVKGIVKIKEQLEKYASQNGFRNRMKDV